MVSIVMLPRDVGITLAGEKEQEVPLRFPERLVRSQDNVTLVGLPAIRVDMILVEPEPPGTSVMPPELDREYSRPANA